MKQGTTTTFNFHFNIDLNQVSSIDFFFHCDRDNKQKRQPLLTKTYPTHGYEQDGVIYMPLKQEETAVLPNKFYIEPQINFIDKSSTKAHTKAYNMEPTIYTHYLDENQSSGEEENIDIEFEVDESIVIKGYDYEESYHKPRINDNELVGNKTGAELDLQDKLIAGANIAIAADGKTISAKNGGKFIIVEELPEEDIDLTAIYLLPREDEEESNIYDEYIYIENISKWEKIGSTEVNLDNYYTKNETNTLLNSKQNNLSNGYGIDLENNNIDIKLKDSADNLLFLSQDGLGLSGDIGTDNVLRNALVSTYFSNPLASKNYVDTIALGLGNALDVSIDSQTYVMTLQLKHGNDVLSTGTVDLPLESVVVSGSYDSQTKEVVLTLQGGSTIRFSVADLVSGLQSEITPQNKLSADLVDDTTSTNKFTNASEKTGWNETKNDVEQIERDYFTDGDNYNMLNPTNSVKGTIGTTGNVSESSTSPYLVSEYIPVKYGKTYALTYKNATYQSRYALTPNRMCFFDTSKTFKEQSTTSSTSGTYFNSESVTVSGVEHISYYKFTPLQDGYIRFQYGDNLNEPQMAIGSTIEYMDYYTPPLVLANEVVDENNLTRELQQKINGENGLYEFNYVKLHEKVLFAGDSLTEGYQGTDDIRKDKSYPTIASKLMNCEGVNKGVSGITTLAWWQNYGSQIDYSDYDGLFVYLGTNGGLTDTVEEDTASGDYHTYAETNTGGYCAVIAKALDDNPDIKIYVVKYGTTETSNITQEIADKYGVPTILVTDTRYFTLTDNFYHTDMTHYNSVGYWALANVLMIQVEEYIEEHLADYTDLPSAKMTSYQPLIDSTHKLSADNVDDTNTTNKFVLAQEKQGWDDKADDTVISTDTTSTTVSLTLADNHEYRYTQDLTSLTLTMPSGDFIASIVFASGSTPTSMTYDSNIKWSGDDVTGGQFVPTEKTYNVVMWYDGININGVVRGV